MKKFFEHLWAHIIKWNEYISIPLALFIWWASPTFLRLIDGTAAIYDAGVFQVILFTIIQLLVYNGVVWIIIKLTFPGIYNFLDSVLEEKILGNGSISQWEKVKLTLWIFSIYFIGIILLSHVIS